MASQDSRAHTATARYVRVSARKARLLVETIRDKRVDIALDTLRFSKKGFARDLYKLLDSAVANVANSDLGWDLDRLYVSKAFVNEGPTMRRFRPRAMGRATRIRKRTSHITIELSAED